VISLTILTSDRAHLARLLRNRNILDADNNPVAGVEIAVVPNPIVITPAVIVDGEITVPAVMDSRWVYLVKLAHAAEAADEDGTVTPAVDDENPRFTRSKLANFVKNHGTPTTLSNGTRAWSFANDRHVLLNPRDQASFGAWQ
jgi:hypothetical protein